jgi:hypothetical protein
VCIIRAFVECSLLSVNIDASTGLSANIVRCRVTTGYGSEALPIRLNVQRAPNEDDNVLYEVEVFVGYLWICFPQWLQTTFMPRFNYYSADLTHKQVQTWSRNGMIFRLLDLPREIRDIIYLYTMESTGAFRAFYSGGSSEDLVQCLPQEKKASWLTSPMMITDMASVLPPGTCKNLVPDELHFGRFSCGNYQLNRKGDNRLGVILSPLKWRASEPSGRILTLLIVSKQVRKEYICAQWKLAGKSMDASALHIPWYRVACLNLITKFQAHYLLETLNRVQLYIDHYTYVRNYFHVNNYDTDAEMVGFLAALPPIRTLEFRFAKIRQSPPSAFICYKISIDWYFTVLLGHIRHLIQGNHLDQITITRDIKHSTRAMWEEIFADEKKGVIHDMAAKMKLIWSFGIIE